MKTNVLLSSGERKTERQALPFVGHTRRYTKEGEERKVGRKTRNTRDDEQRRKRNGRKKEKGKMDRHTHHKTKKIKIGRRGGREKTLNKGGRGMEERGRRK